MSGLEIRMQRSASLAVTVVDERNDVGLMADAVLLDSVDQEVLEFVLFDGRDRVGSLVPGDYEVRVRLHINPGETAQRRIEMRPGDN